MKKYIFLQSLILTSLIVASPVYAQTAQTADVGQVETFIKSIIQIFVTLAGIHANIFCPGRAGRNKYFLRKIAQNS